VRKQKKSTKNCKSQTPPYLSNGDSVGKFFCTIMFKTLENGGVGHLQIPKRKANLGQNAHVTQKPQIFYILQTLHFLGKLIPSLASKHLKMGGYVHSKLSKCFIITLKPLLLSGDPKFSNPPYLINGDSVGKFYCTIGLRTLINGGVGLLKTPKKKPNFGGNTNVTLKP
jgi:hypothetical protein